MSKEEITEEDFMIEPMEKVPKLTEDWCEEVAKEEDNKEIEEEEAMEEDTKAKDDIVETEKQPEHGSVPYFR